MPTPRQITDYAGEHGLLQTYKHFNISKQEYAEILRELMAEFYNKKIIRDKVCTKCKIRKNLVQFSPHMTTKDGRQSWCKACIRDRRKAYYHKEKK